MCLLPVLACTRSVFSAMLQVYDTIPPKVLLEYRKYKKGQRQTEKLLESCWKMYLQIFKTKRTPNPD